MSTGQYDDLIVRAAAQYNITPRLLKLVMNLESGGNPTPKEAGQGALGLFQIKPDTMEAMGYGRDPYNVEKAAFAAAKYLSQGIDQTGDALGAVGYYHSGSANRAAWGPNTNYHLQKAIAQWNGAQVNDDPTNPDSYRPTPAGNSTSDVTALVTPVRQGGNVTNKNTTRPRYTPAEIRADERFPPDAGSTPPAAPATPIDPDVAAGRQMMEESLRDNPPPAAATPAPVSGKPVDPDVAAGRAMMQEVYDTPDAPTPVKPQVALPSEEQLRNIELTGGASELGNLLTNPGFWRGVAQPYRSGRELLARAGDATGLSKLMNDPTYQQVHAQNVKDQAEFDAAHPDSQAIQGAGNFIGTTGALMAGGGLVGAAAKGVPYVAPAVRFLGGNSSGMAAPLSGAANGAVANTAANALNSSMSDKPLPEQLQEGLGTAAALGGVVGTVTGLPMNRLQYDTRNAVTSPAFRKRPFDQHYPLTNEGARDAEGHWVANPDAYTGPAPSSPNPVANDYLTEMSNAHANWQNRIDNPTLMDKAADLASKKYAPLVAASIGAGAGHLLMGDALGGGLLGTVVTDAGAALGTTALQRLVKSQKPKDINDFMEEYARRKWLMDNGYGNLLTSAGAAARSDRTGQ